MFEWLNESYCENLSGTAEFFDGVAFIFLIVIGVISFVLALFLLHWYFGSCGPGR